MIEIIKSKNNFCKGCNRCVRECPMETTNITYQDEDGNIKVKIDQDKCIACGRCITACKHNARYFEDDTERFFNDLSCGVPISLIAAPSIRTNIPEYKKLFSYLKKLGVGRIYDVSLGADICIWAHVKKLEENSGCISPIITQPCPAIVSYCEMYRHDLIPRLSPIHSPMACTSIYMKEYQGIKDNIAALSPCIAKSREFHDTKLAQYNITFLNLLEYLKKNNITFTDEEIQFDHDESGLGSLFPMPGGLKENIEYFTGRKIHITTAGGIDIYEKLDKYAQTPVEFLPDIYDVLNCSEGCNLGSAYLHDKNIFEINKTMNNKRWNVTQADKKEYYQSIFKTYDDTLNLRHFIREYHPVMLAYPKITDEDINRAFHLLGKTDYDSQNIDCGACGSMTCRHMARKIALNVNIPVNCIVKSMIEAKAEHEDIMNIREHETELLRSQAKNELQLTKLNAVVKATKIGLWDVIVYDYNPLDPRNIYTWSDEFRYMLGYSNEIDFPNTAESYFGKLHPDDIENAYIAVKKHLEDHTGGTPYDVEYRLLCKNGEYAYFRACGESIRNNKGTVLRIAGAVMDITESKKVLLKTERQRNEAEEANRAKSLFLSNMSHEIRTPLNAIIGMTAIGQLSNDIDKKNSAFNKIDGASKHLLGVINDILDMSKIEANKLELSHVNFGFKKMLQKVADIINPGITEKRLNFNISTDEKIPEVLIGDDQRLSQVITNLLSNAVKFTPKEGSISLDSHLVSEANGMCCIEISVTDTGIGIANDQQSRLFESFEQADAGTSRNFGGTGLGLPISKRIVQLMDGNIRIESKPGAGSKFTVSILLKRGADIDKSNDIKETNADTGSNFPGKIILLAEDMEINREIVITLLESTQITIECAENGKAAVRMFSESPEKYNLIFMDIQMPEMDGYEATEIIRNLDTVNAKTIPIIAMTANVFREDVEKCLKTGMNGHVRKPIDLEEMLDVLRQHL